MGHAAGADAKVVHMKDLTIALSLSIGLHLATPIEKVAAQA